MIRPNSFRNTLSTTHNITGQKKLTLSELKSECKKLAITNSVEWWIQQRSATT
jgi:hypothetical protein